MRRWMAVLGAAGFAWALAPRGPAICAEERFRDATKSSGLADVRAYRVLLYDVDRDGRADAVIQEKDARGPVNPGGKARLFRNLAESKKARFAETKGALDGLTEGSRAAGARETAVFTMFADVNGDGRSDLFRACCQELAGHAEWPDTGERSAVALGAEKGFALAAGSGVGAGPVTTCGAAFLDHDRDGHLDLYVGNWYRSFGQGLVCHGDRLYRGDGTGKFADVTDAAGLTTDADVGDARSSRPTYGVSHTDFDGDGLQDVVVAVYGDFDLDGRLDLLVASASYPDDQRLRIWRQDEKRGFEDVTEDWGIDWRDPWSVAVADVDGDGSLDVLASGQPNKWNGRAEPDLRLWLNKVGSGMRWVAFTLEGTAGTNRDAIGARVRVTAGGITRTREVLSAIGHFGMQPPREVHFGLGSAATVDVEVRWPDKDATTQTFRAVATNRRWRLRQGAAAPEAL